MDKKTYYIHIPKTGGSYIKHNPVFPVKHLSHVYIGAQYNPLYYPRNAIPPETNINWTFVRSKRAIADANVFCAVRNPFSFLVSYYHHCEGPKHYDNPIHKKGFKEFVKAIANREDPWPSRKFIFCQMFAGDGDMIVDYVCRQERLDADLQDMAMIWGLEYKQKARARVYKHPDYRTYYDEELIRLVWKTWSREFKMFGYDFDGLIPHAEIGLTGTQRNKLKYHFDKDELIQWKQ